MEGIEIRALNSLEELSEVEALQQLIWDAPSMVVYRPMLISFTRNGGSVIGAINDRRVVGFVLSYLGVESPDADRPAMANLKLVSQRMGILPEYRNLGIGYELKLAQRRFAVEQGLRLITWTFDPLRSRNAHLNIRKLGAIAREYYRDYYGTELSPMVSLRSSDRLLAEWWVTSNRVEQRVRGGRSALFVTQYLDANARILNPSAVGKAGLAHPCDRAEKPESNLVLVEIPNDYDAMVSYDPELAQAWRAHIRDTLEGVMRSGYAIIDFIHGSHEGRQRGFYALSYTENGDVQMRRFSSN
jgi:predicted GNAT superfamily acetyltransferase